MCFTFGNIRTATDGQPVSLVSEVETARSYRCSLGGTVPTIITERAKRAVSSSPVYKVAHAENDNHFHFASERSERKTEPLWGGGVARPKAERLSHL